MRMCMDRFDFDLAASDVTRQQCARSMQHASSACIQMYMYHRVTRRVTRKVGTFVLLSAEVS